MIKFVYLILYIIILFILLFIIYNYYYIIEKYVDITHFGDFTECPTCSNGQQLIGCKGLSQGSCQSCPAGTAGTGGTCDIKCSGNKYSSSGFTDCQYCPDGKKPNSNNTACVDCPAGTAGTGGTCTPCTDKYYTSRRGSTSCSLCNTNGKRVNSNNTNCEDCPAGTAGTDGTCTPCTDKYYTSSRGLTSCSLCNTNGKRVNSNNTNCEDCPAGTAGTDGTCTPCTDKYYTSSRGLKSCSLCPNGKSVNSNNTNCEDCPAGTAGTGDTCTRCTGNTYSSEPGSDTCDTCDIIGSGVNNYNTTCEPCPKGKYEINGNCYTCPTNQYSDSSSSIDCTHCEDGKIVNSYKTGCEPRPLIQIYCGFAHTMFLTSEGNIYGCGYNHYNQINSGSDEYYSITRPAEIEFTNFDPQLNESEKITQIACGEKHTIFLTSLGNVYGCGNNDYNQVSSIDSHITRPTKILDFPETVQITQIACGDNHTMFLTSLGKVWGCGYNYYNQVNLSSKAPITRPTEITDFPETVQITQIACGDEHTMFLTSQGKVYGCGRNNHFQVKSSGNTVDTPTEITNFVPQLASNEYIIQFACGSGYTMFLTSKGKVYGCGLNEDNQVSSSGYGQITQPTEITNFFPQLASNEYIIQIACGGFSHSWTHYGGGCYTMFLTSQGKVYGCGNNDYYQINLSSKAPITRPTEISNYPQSEYGDKIIQIGCGSDYTIFSTSNGKVYGYGTGYGYGKQFSL
jgi:alpha-tubulin suppressor-like RCC1 family protein